MKVIVTGGSGIVGHYVIDELVRHGCQVLNVDRVLPGSISHSTTVGINASVEPAIRLREGWGSAVKFTQADVTDYGQVVSAMGGNDAIIHLAAMATSLGFVEEPVFSTNTTSMWNIMRAAEQLNIQKVILGSSYNAIGAQVTAIHMNTLPSPEYFPIDEDHPSHAQDAYSVSKWVGEQVAGAFARRNPEMQLVSLRFNGMWDDGRMRNLASNPIMDVRERVSGFWSYLHIRDAAIACRMAVEGSWQGHHVVFLNAKDTMLAVPTMEAITKVYPDVPVRRQLDGFESPLEIKRAVNLLGWEPQHSWRGL